MYYNTLFSILILAPLMWLNYERDVVAVINFPLWDNYSFLFQVTSKLLACCFLLFFSGALPVWTVLRPRLCPQFLDVLVHTCKLGTDDNRDRVPQERPVDVRRDGPRRRLCVHSGKLYGGKHLCYRIAGLLGRQVL